MWLSYNARDVQKLEKNWVTVKLIIIIIFTLLLIFIVIGWVLSIGMIKKLEPSAGK
jgi:amino acid transporter